MCLRLRRKLLLESFAAQLSALYSNTVMRFLEINEIWAWCAEAGIGLLEQARPASDPRLTHSARWLYADGERSGREPGLARVAISQLAPWHSALLWITQTGVWPSTEDWPAYYAMRGRVGERRSLDVAPGHLFDASQGELLIEFVTATMENGWDAFVLSERGMVSGDTRIRISHDEWIELQSTRPVSFSVAAV